jgi:hypothetical protein
MYAGATINTIGGVLTLALGSTSASGQTSSARGLGALIAASVWLWMADKNGKGRGWARVLSAVLFGIDTLGVLVFLPAALGAAGPGGRNGAVTLVLFVSALLLWLVGLGAIISIFSRESGRFYELWSGPR